MPIGTASKEGTSAGEGRDALDSDIAKALRRMRRPAPPQHPDRPPDEALLRYVDGVLDRDAHATLEQHLLSDDGARGRVAALKQALSEPPSAPTAGRLRYLFYLAHGKLRLLRGTALLPPPDGHPGAPEILIAPDLGTTAPWLAGPRGPGLELRLRPCGGAVDLSLRAAGAAVSLCRGTELLGGDGPDSDGRLRFPALPPARYELRICIGADELPPVVLDIRTA